MNHFVMKTVPVPDLLLILDRLALDLRLNVTINVTAIGEYIFLHCECILVLMEHVWFCCPDTVLVVQEVFPGSGRTLGVQVEDSYISLPGELFKNLKKSGLQALKSVIL